MTTYRHDATVAPQDAPDLEPDDADVLQDEGMPGLTTIPVCVDGPVRVQQLPAKAAGYRRVTVTTTTPQRVLGRDPRRKRAVLQVFDSAGATRGVFYGATLNEVTPPAALAARLAVASPAVAGATVASPVLELTGQDELWVVADTAVCELTVTAEQWAD